MRKEVVLILLIIEGILLVSKNISLSDLFLVREIWKKHMDCIFYQKILLKILFGYKTDLLKQNWIYRHIIEQIFYLDLVVKKKILKYIRSREKIFK